MLAYNVHYHNPKNNRDTFKHIYVNNKAAHLKKDKFIIAMEMAYEGIKKYGDIVSIRSI